MTGQPRRLHRLILGGLGLTQAKGRPHDDPQPTRSHHRRCRFGGCRGLSASFDLGQRRNRGQGHDSAGRPSRVLLAEESQIQGRPRAPAGRIADAGRDRDRQSHSHRRAGRDRAAGRGRLPVTARRKSCSSTTWPARTPTRCIPFTRSSSPTASTCGSAWSLYDDQARADALMSSRSVRAART